MAGNESLSARNRTPADEFYTQLTHIEAEVRHYRDQFRGSEAHRREAYERQSGICPKCGKHFEIGEMEADHITPWSKRGKTNGANCQMLCLEDNRRKGAV